jgi:ribosomal protein S18 acetylase RimI-like enzyme
MNITIRKAERRDCPRLLQLVHELAAYERAPQEVTVTEAHFTESGFGLLPVWWGFVAEAIVNGEQVIVGFANYYIRFSTWKGQRMYLEDLVVTEAWRGKGIGRQLLDALITEAKEKRFGAVVWQVLEWNEPAIAFYKKYPVTFDNGWVNVALELN